MNGTASSKVVAGKVEEPAIGVPGPVGDGVVDDGGPKEHEDDGGEDTTSISNGTDCKSRTGDVRTVNCQVFEGNSRNGSEHALVQTKENIRESGRAIGLSEGVHKTKLGQVAEEGVSSS